MMTHLIRICLLLSISLGLARMACAVPVLAVDADPLTPGVQSSGTVFLGDPVTVGLFISGVDPGQPLQSFQLSLNYDSTLLAGTAISDGHFLADQVLEVLASFDQGRADYALAHLGPEGVSGEGLLATITFSTLNLGVTSLSLTDIILSAPYGDEITPFSFNDGSLNIISRWEPVVPEPATLLLAALGCALLAGRRGLRRASRRFFRVPASH